MLDCVYSFLRTNFYEVVHGALHNNVHDFDDCCGSFFTMTVMLPCMRKKNRNSRQNHIRYRAQRKGLVGYELSKVESVVSITVTEKQVNTR